MDESQDELQILRRRVKELERALALAKEREQGQATAALHPESEQTEKDRLQGVLEAAGAACHEVSQPVQGIASCLFEAQMNLPMEHPAQAVLEKADGMVKRVREILVKLSSITRYATREYVDGRQIVDLERSTGQGE